MKKSKANGEKKGGGRKSEIVRGKGMSERRRLDHEEGREKSEKDKWLER